jgi:hypothetical protein
VIRIVFIVAILTIGAVIWWVLSQRKNLNALLKIGCVLLLFTFPVMAQDPIPDDDIQVVVMEHKPLVFPDQIVDASSIWQTAQENASWWDGVYRFLYNNATNNTSMFRPTKIIEIA